MGEFTMPSLGADMEAGTLTQWLIKAGDQVHRGDIVAVVDTDKSTIEVEIFENGVVDQLVVHEGEHVPVGTILARVSGTAPATAPEVTRPVALPRVQSASIPAGDGQTPSAPISHPTLAPVVHSPVVRRLAERLGVDLASVAGSGPGGRVTRADVEHAGRRRRNADPGERVRSSPLARRRATELGVDVSKLVGTGPGGSVIERDVASAATPAPPDSVPGIPAPATQPASSDRQAALRKAIGALMARSKRDIPHYYLSTTIDVGAAAAWLERANLARPVPARLVLPVLLIKATALAVAKVPEMNGFFTDDRFTPGEAVHVGVAISLRAGGVVAPALHETNHLGLDELMDKLRDLVGRARVGVLRSSEMSDPTITVTNLGDLGVESVFGVIYPPQVALVGFGQVTERPIAKDGLVGARPCLNATLSADHRVSDGHRGGRFLTEINRLLQEPEKL